MAQLKESSILFIDIQATGANPERDHVMEVGWAVADGSFGDSAIEVESRLAALPDGVDIPRRITRVTGLTTGDFAGAKLPETVFRTLFCLAESIQTNSQAHGCPAVIHYARYESPFLRHFHELTAPERAFPLDIICTHEITKRLLPGLPRRSLRAVAGYFGHSIGELRRASGHIEATVMIWRSLVEMLESSCGITTFEDLKTWLEETDASCRTGRDYHVDRSVRLAIPDSPGIYRMYRSNGDILYVGKAKSLRRRVNSYFTKQKGHSEHILEMLSQATDIDVTIAGSALEAAVREQDEIKRLNPPYNKALRERDRDIWFTGNNYSGAMHFPEHYDDIGPFPSRETIDSLSALRKITTREIDCGDSEPSFIQAVLDLPPEYCPEQAVFADGAADFLERHAHLFDTDDYNRAVQILGTMLHRDYLAEIVERRSLEESEDAILPDIADETEDTDEWTPEHVVRVMERAVWRGAYLQRKARWLVRLSESVIAWESDRMKDRNRYNFIVIENGELSIIGSSSCLLSLSPPPGWDRPVSDRKRSFSVATYDRMRIITTELRRLASDNRRIMICVSPHSVITEKHLDTILPWI